MIIKIEFQLLYINNQYFTITFLLYSIFCILYINLLIHMLSNTLLYIEQFYFYNFLMLKFV
jgi:hypothetical protein